MMTTEFPEIRTAMEADGLLPSSLNGFISDEMAAQVAYQRMADRAAGTREAGILRQFEEEHELAAASLSEHLRELGSEPTDRSGSLGLWAAAVRGSSGDSTRSFSNLLTAERALLERYEGASALLDHALAQLMRNLLVPAQKRHVTIMEGLARIIH